MLEADGPVETILVVDDEPIVLNLVSNNLSRRGYCVLPTKDGTEAIRCYERQKRPVHLLLTDIMMPGLTGFEVAEQITQWNRRLPVLFMSGHDRETVLSDRAPQASFFLRKPFTEEELLARVREALAHGARVPIERQMRVSGSTSRASWRIA